MCVEGPQLADALTTITGPDADSFHRAQQLHQRSRPAHGLLERNRETARSRRKITRIPGCDARLVRMTMSRLVVVGGSYGGGRSCPM